ncbi:MAG: N-acetylneuraminate synthase [Candidatus Anstonellales archaeon]
MMSDKKITIKNRSIGNGSPCFIIAEAGVNHNGKLGLAKKLIDAAKRAGADAVKFQVFSAEDVVTKRAPKAAYQKRATGKGTQYEMLKELELSESEFETLAKYAKRKGIVFLASAFSEEGVDLLERLGVPAFKVPSGEITNFPLLRHIARKGKPIILSTGMSTLGEVQEALEVMGKEGAEEIVLLHCVSNYPAKIEEVNLRAMETLRSAFGVPVGLSDHTVGITIPIAAVAIGASIVEKHLTLSKKLPGPDHKASLEPDEFKRMVVGIREVERALGDGVKRPTKSEEIMKKIVRKSIVAKTSIPKGAIISKDMLEIKRPGTGLEPKYIDKIVGKKARKDIEAGEIIKSEKIVW